MPLLLLLLLLRAAPTTATFGTHKLPVATHVSSAILDRTFPTTMTLAITSVGPAQLWQVVLATEGYRCEFSAAAPGPGRTLQLEPGQPCMLDIIGEGFHATLNGHLVQGRVGFHDNAPFVHLTWSVAGQVQLETPWGALAPPFPVQGTVSTDGPRGK